MEAFPNMATFTNRVFNTRTLYTHTIIKSTTTKISIGINMPLYLISFPRLIFPYLNVRTPGAGFPNVKNSFSSIQLYITGKGWYMLLFTWMVKQIRGTNLYRWSSKICFGKIFLVWCVTCLQREGMKIWKVNLISSYRREKLMIISLNSRSWRNTCWHKILVWESNTL